MRCGYLFASNDLKRSVPLVVQDHGTLQHFMSGEQQDIIVYSRTFTLLGRCLLHGAGRILPLQHVATRYLPKENLSELPFLLDRCLDLQHHPFSFLEGFLWKR